MKIVLHGLVRLLTDEHLSMQMNECIQCCMSRDNSKNLPIEINYEMSFNNPVKR